MTHSDIRDDTDATKAAGSVLLGQGRQMLRVPHALWQRHLREQDRLGFMSEDHHHVRNLVVRELPRAGRPLSPQSIAQRLGLHPERVVQLLEDLERHKTFLFRNEEGAVTWAYPVTVAETPHLAVFDSGESVHAA
jgi:hypothetical protein